jgi:hypothetical protein
MKSVTIRRCPSCSTIGDHTKQLETELREDPNLNVRVVDGSKGEFAVDVDGRKIEGMSGEDFRTAGEIASDVMDMERVTAG